MPRQEDLTPPDVETEARLRDRIIWVDGRVRIGGFDRKAVLDCDRAAPLLAGLGLQLYVKMIEAGEEPPEDLRNRIDPRRIPLSDVELHACSPSGKTEEEIAREAYYIVPWTEKTREVALRKTQVALEKLRKAKRLVRWYRDDGTAIWGRFGWRPGPGVPVVPPEDLPTSAMIRAGRNLLEGDGELARKVYEAMFALREPGRKPAA